MAKVFLNFYVFILEGEEWGGERDCFVVTAYLCIHRLILLCVLTGIELTTLVYWENWNSSATNCVTPPGPKLYF